VFLICAGCVPEAPDQKIELGEGGDFTLNSVYGEPVSLSDYEEKVVLLAFFAEWCGPCKEEIPHFIELQNEYGDEGFTVLGISVGYMDARGMKIFAEERDINYPVLLNDGKVSKKYGPIKSIPTTVILDKSHKIAKRYIGYRTKETVERDVRELLGLKTKE
jgi:thiol-disulfide isomerase/thioredoxin